MLLQVPGRLFGNLASRCASMLRILSIPSCATQTSLAPISSQLLQGVMKKAVGIIMFCSVNNRKACFLYPDALQTIWFCFERLTVLRYTRLISIYCPCVPLSQQKKKENKKKPKQQTFLVNTKYLLLTGLYIYILHIQLLLRSICIYMSSAVWLATLYPVPLPPQFYFFFMKRHWVVSLACPFLLCLLASR